MNRLTRYLFAVGLVAAVAIFIPEYEWSDSETRTQPANSPQRDAGTAEPAAVSPTAGQNKEDPSAADSSQQDLTAPGTLTEIRPDEFRSVAGLIYARGSADGHRLKHLLKHARDDLSKPVHGVFEASREEILAMLDEAFLASQDISRKRDVRTEISNNRRVITVNMNRRIGYVGGQTGKQERNPECRYLRIVLEQQNRVITAYPTQRF